MMQKGFGAAKKVMMVGIDGMDPLYTRKLLAEGKLPNFQKFLARGTTTKDMGMMGVLPAYTPPSWCTLATGAWPGTHGITDFWNHKRGDELSKLSLGFNSTLCKVDYAWDTFAEEGKKVIVYGWPTSWPPRNPNTIMIDGSGVHPFLANKVDYEKFIDCQAGDFPLQFIPHDNNDSGAECFVTEDIQELEFKPTMPAERNQIIGNEGGEDDNIGGKYDLVKAPIKPSSGWANAPANAMETVIVINTGRTRRYVLITADDGIHYNRVQLYRDKKQEVLLGEATVGNWMENVMDEFSLGGDKKEQVGYHIKVATLAEDASSLTMYYSYALSANDDCYAQPASLKKELYDKFGVPLLLSNMSHEEVDKMAIMADCGERAFKWSMDTIDYILDNYEWDAAFHGLHIIDFANHLYLDHTLPQFPTHEFNKECLERFYAIADEYVGRMLKWLDQDVAIMVVSDHGGLIKYPDYDTPKIGDAWGLNVGLMEELGYTKTKVVNGTLEIDWEHTTAIAQRSSYIYVNLKGRDPQGIVDPAELDELVTKIISDLYAYRDPVHGERVISMAMRRSEMAVLGLNDASEEGLGDIFFMLEPKFTRDQGNSFSNCEILGTSLKCMFMMAGPGIKENYIIPRDVQEVDVTPTLCHLFGSKEMPNGVEGGVLYQALK